jgi:hypothetical protein
MMYYGPQEMAEVALVSPGRGDWLASLRMVLQESGSHVERMNASGYGHVGGGGSGSSQRSWRAGVGSDASDADLTHNPHTGIPGSLGPVRSARSHGSRAKWYRTMGVDVGRSLEGQTGSQKV